MVFTTPIFLFYFLPLVLGVYYLLPAARRSLFLVLASYVFYGWWSPWFVTLMLASTVVDWLCGGVIARSPRGARASRWAVAVSVTANLSLLGFFKYWRFLAENVDRLVGPLLAGQPLPLWEIVLPVGISFYTFQSMSYTLDLYRGHARPAPSFLDFAAYVSLFPQLVAGPIIRYRTVAEQLHRRSHTVEKMAQGLGYFALGFAKKVLLANNAGLLADAVFAADAPPWHLAWAGAAAYAFQIYFDFSGYSDMAIGLGRMLGFRFPQNFESPYRSASITEFWRRWHISLSTWLRDYLYIPLGGNRRGRVRTYVNLAITMLLGGLWHGAQWQFVVWGAYHGVLLALERALGRRFGALALPRPLRIGATFALVLVSWVPFRAPSLTDAVLYLRSMFGLREATAASSLVSGQIYGRFGLTVLVCCALLTWLGRPTRWWVEDGPRPLPASAVRRWAVVGLFVVAMLEMLVQSHNPFLYFQF